MKNMIGAQVMLKDGSPIENLTIGGQQLLSQSTGEINAHDKGELMQRIGQLMALSSQGEIVRRDSAAIDAGRALISEAYDDATGAKWASLGSDLANKVHEYSERNGFMRGLLMPHTLRQGETPRIPVKSLDVIAVVANGMANMGFQRVTQKVLNVPEFEVKGNVRVSRLDLEQIAGDLLDDAYQQCLEAITTQEDRLWKQAADMTVGKANPITYLGAKLTPASLARLQEKVSGWNLPVRKALIANDFWVDIQGSADWHTALDPVTKYDLLFNGRLATISGMEITTDGFRDPKQRVLERGEIYVISEPEYHGVFTNRGGVQSTPTDGANSGDTDKGWLLSELLSLTIANTRSVAKGIRD